MRPTNTVRFASNMFRNKTGSSWIVQKLIDEDHIKNHYRRLNGAQSHLQTLKTNTTSVRLSKSSNDLRFEHKMQSLERQMSNEFCLDVTVTNEKKKEIFDASLDVMKKHSNYFTQPKKLFTPRVVRKIVRPSLTSHTTRQQSLPPTRSITPSSRPKSVTISRKPNSTIYYPADLPQQRNVSDDSAYGDEHYSSSRSSSSSSSDELTAFNFKKWLKEQDEESYYMKLMCDVTADLLQRHLCTNGNMKEIISTYVRKSRKKFSVSGNVLMQRLCDDLLIPTDDSFDDQFYGSKYSSSFYQKRKDYRSPIKEIEPPPPPINRRMVDECCQWPSDDLLDDEPDHLSNNNQDQTSRRGSSQKQSPLHSDRTPNRENIVESAHATDPQPGPSTVSGKLEIDVGKVPDVDGYFSDFDTENDIEEEFDFD